MLKTGVLHSHYGFTLWATLWLAEGFSPINMDNGLLMRTKNYESSNWLAFWAVQSAAQTKSIYVEKNVSNTPPHSGSKLQKPAKIRLKNFGKLTYLLCSCRNLITFEYEVDLNRKGKSIEICRKFVAWNL